MDALIKRLKRHEGFKGFPYQCDKGYWTGGYGHRFPLSEHQAEMILLEDVYHVSDLYVKWKGENRLKLSQVRDEVLMEMIFWHGMRGFLGFRKMIQALKSGDYERAADEMMDSDSGRKYPARMYELSVLMRDG